MSASLIVFIIIHVLIFAFFVESLRRTAMRVSEYPLDEKPETLPFGFVRLKHIIVLYVLVYIAWVVFSIWLFNVFTDYSFFTNGSGSSNSTILNL
jgi:hypothetical protein